jgi:hypothetical protein
MDQALDPKATAEDVKHVIRVIAQLPDDVFRAMQAVVPIALRETIGDLVEPAVLERAAEVIFAATAARYKVLSAATLRAI